MHWWVSDRIAEGRVTELISQLFWVVLAITLHELAHGWAAIWQGDETPRALNRMTMNPMVHMGPFSFLALALIGIAWGLMPVDPSRFRWGRKGRAFVAAAGPAMNIALAVVSLFLLALWSEYGPSEGSLAENVGIFLSVGGFLNVVLAMFNMLPVPPLDGANVLSGLSMRAYIFFQKSEVQRFGILAILVMFFVVPGIGAVFFEFAGAVAATILKAFLFVLPTPGG